MKETKGKGSILKNMFKDFVSEDWKRFSFSDLWKGSSKDSTHQSPGSFLHGRISPEDRVPLGGGMDKVESRGLPIPMNLLQRLQ